MERIDFKNYPDESTPLSAENLNQLQTNIEEAIFNSIEEALKVESIEDQAGVFLIGNVRIEFGMLDNITVPASGYKTGKITFSKAFSTTPAVFLQQKGNYNIKFDVSSNNMIEAVINMRSVDGNERTNRSFYWLAIGKN